MKVAIPTKNNNVDDHFGHCEAYTVFTVDATNKIEKTEMLPSPKGCGCKSNIATVLKEMGVDVLLAGNMGDGALQILKNQGIEVYRGCTGDVKQVTETFLIGKIADSGEGCSHHGEEGGDHVCSH